MSKLTRFNILAIGTDAIPVKNLTLNPLEVDFIDDENMTGYFDASAGRAAARWATPSFTTELKGRASSQALTDTLSIHSLLLACGFTGAAGASDYVYTLSSNPNVDKTLVSTMYTYLHAEIASGTNALRHSFSNIATDATFKFPAGQIAEIDWSSLGKYVAIPDLATVVSTLATEGNPLRCMAGTITTTIGGAAKTLVLNNLTLALGNNLVMPDSTAEAFGKAAPEITNRVVTTELTVIEPDKATVDFWYAMQESGVIDFTPQLIDWSLQLGTTAKNKIKIEGGGYMYGIPERVDIDGISYYTIRLKYDRSTLHAVPATIKITCT